MSTIKLKEQAAQPSTPSTDEKRVYVKSDGLYTVDDAGTEEKIGPSTGMSNPMTTLSDLIIADTGGSPIRLAANPLSSQLFLSSVSGVTSFQPIPAQGVLVYYSTPTASDVGSALKQLVDPYVTPTTLSTPTVASGTVLLQTFVTEPSNPNRAFIPAGEYAVHIHASTTGGSRTYQILVEIWECNASGADIQMLASCGPSIDLTGSNSEYIVAQSTTLKNLAGTSSRIKTKIYSVGSVGGSSGTVSIYVGGTDDTRINLPAPVVDATNFVPYTGATANVDLGTFNLSVVDEVYGAGWNGSLQVPTKNAVYDKIEGLVATSFGTVGQIPYTNAGGNDFDYSSLLTFDGTDLRILADSSKLYFGAADDASITYDGTDLIINPTEVGSGNLNIFSTGSNNLSGLNITRDQDAGTYLEVENENTGTGAFASTRVDSDASRASLIAHGSGRVSTHYGTALGGFSEVLANVGNGLMIGTLALNKPIIFGTNNIEVMRLTGTSMKLPNDNAKLYFGAADDASITYNGTDMVINPREVGSGKVNITGQTHIKQLSTSDVLRLSSSAGGYRVLGIFYNVDTQPKWSVGDSGVIYWGVGGGTGPDSYLHRAGVASLYTNSNLIIRADNKALILGAGDDASIYYDGTDLKISSALVGSGTIDLVNQSASAVTAETLSEYVIIKIGGVSKKIAIIA